MFEDTLDDLVEFPHVRLIEASVSALWCAIGQRNVWLPRLHVRGALRSRGDRGTLRIRRWLAQELKLPMPGSPAAAKSSSERAARRHRFQMRAVADGPTQD